MTLTTVLRKNTRDFRVNGEQYPVTVIDIHYRYKLCTGRRWRRPLSSAAETALPLWPLLSPSASPVACDDASVRRAVATHAQSSLMMCHQCHRQVACDTYNASVHGKTTDQAVQYELMQNLLRDDVHDVIIYRITSRMYT